jgi:hypothetical protein
VDGFVEALKPIYPILCEASTGAYSTGGVPQAYLIGADGTVVWQGHPAGLKDDDIEEHLKKLEKGDRVSTWAFTLSRQLPPVPEKLAGAQKMLEDMKFGAALKSVEGALARLEGDEKAAGEAVRDWIAKRGRDGIEKAATLHRDGQVYKAFLKYEELEELFKGHDLSKEAKNAAKALKSGKETGLEIKASEKLEQVKKDMAGEKDPEDKLKCLKPLLAKKYADTAAGKEAAKLAEELEKAEGEK